MNLPFFIAKRYFISKKSHNAINIISIISIAGVGVCTMALVIVLSAFNGLSSVVQSLYNSFDADIVITVKNGKKFDANTSDFKKIKTIKGVKDYTCVVEGNALLKFNDKQCIATIKGVGNEFQTMSMFDTLVREGNFNIDKNNIVIGKGISDVLQTTVNNMFSTVSLYAPKHGTRTSINTEDGLNEMKAYSVGTFSISDEFDNKYVLMSIGNARSLLDYKNEVTSIEVKLANKLSNDEVVKNISSLIGNHFVIKNKEQQNELLFKTLKSEKLWTFIILVFILIIATFNIISSLSMLIIEKQKDIFVLKNLGANNMLIKKIFLIEGFLLTFIGALTGVLLGAIICLLQIKFSLIHFSQGYVVDSYPIKFIWTDFASILGIVMLIGLVAAWYPVKILTLSKLKYFNS